MPAQSYLANVPDSVAICTTEASLHTYRDLGPTSVVEVFPVTLGLMATFLEKPVSIKSHVFFRTLWKSSRNQSLALLVHPLLVLMVSNPNVLLAKARR